MKKITIILVLLISAMTFAQANVDETLTFQQEIIDTTDGLVGLAKLADISTIKGMFMDYTTQAVESSKDVLKSGMELAEEAIEKLWAESTIIVRQFIIYTSITFAIPIIIGILLIVFLPGLIRRHIEVDKDKAVSHNTELTKHLEDSKTVDRFKHGELYIYYMGSYFKTKYMSTLNSILKYTIWVMGVFVIFPNVMPFIKVTFFSKLYLTEILINYIR